MQGFGEGEFKDEGCAGDTPRAQAGRDSASVPLNFYCCHLLQASERFLQSPELPEVLLGSPLRSRAFLPSPFLRLSTSCKRAGHPCQPFLTQAEWTTT